MKTRADLMALPAFARLAVDSAGNPCVWRNHYVCQCEDGPQSEWDMDWSCCCEDDCPECGESCGPYESDWLPVGEQARALWESLPEAGAA